MSPDASTRWTAVAVFLGAVAATLVLQIFLTAGARDRQGSDYEAYYRPTATSILEGRGYSTPEGRVQTRIPPGYPLLLAAALGLGQAAGAGEAAAVRLLMALCMGASSAAIFLIAAALWGRLPALVPALLWITCPFTQFLPVQLGSEVPFLPVFYGATGLFLREILRGTVSPAPFFIAGLMAGVATLIRPIGIGLGGLFAILLWYLTRAKPLRLRVTLVAFLLLGNAAALIPWEAWLYLKTGRFIVLSDAGGSTLREGWTFGIRPGQPEARAVVGEDVSELMNEFANAENGGTLVSTLGVLVRETGRHPAAVAHLIWLKLTRCWYGTDSLRFEGAILLVQIVYLPLLLFAGWWAWRAGAAGRIATLLTGALILYFWGMTFLVIPLLRYLTPVESLAFVLVPAVFLRFRRSAVVGPSPIA